MNGEVIILGCGCSAGTPRIGGDWGKADPLNKKNYRTRPSIAVQKNETTLIVDTGADFREQCNREKILNIDAVLYTHAHSDHINGLDDIRSYYYRRQKTPVPLYMNAPTYKEIFARFQYVFQTKTPLYPATGLAKIWSDDDFYQSHKIGDIEFYIFSQDHGGIDSIGFRFGDVGYSTDMMNLNERAIEILQGVKHWIVDGANWNMKEEISHCNLDKLKNLQELVNPQNMYLTHLKNDTDYDSLNAILPRGMQCAFDGLRLPC